MKGRKGGLSVKLRRVLALVLALLLALSLGGCAAPADAAVLCSAEAAPAGRAMAEAGTVRVDEAGSTRGFYGAAACLA